MNGFGRIFAHLPRPDMVVTRSRWDVYLPDRFRYGTPNTNMDLVVDGIATSRRALQAEMVALRRSAAVPQPMQPLQIEVPDAGVHYAFTKLYANQSEQDAFFSLPYTSGAGARLGLGLSLLGTALFWIACGLALRSDSRLPRGAWWTIAAIGALLALGPVGYVGLPLLPVLILSGVVVIAGAALQSGAWRRFGTAPRGPEV